MTVPRIFDRDLRRLRRDRAARRGAADFFAQLAADEITDRLDSVQRRFVDALVIGVPGDMTATLRSRGLRTITVDAGALYAAATGGILADEDRLPIPESSVDLVVSTGGLDQVDDLPGALILARRVLRPDGLFLACTAGAGSLSTLRRALAAADEHGPAAPRFHPQLDVRAAGDLMARAGFALPVADTVGYDVRYADLFALIADLRAAAATNLLVERDRAGLSRARVAAAAMAFAAAADPDGRTRERIEMLVLTGWAPAESQPRPARRGSATRSLADALKPPEE